MCKKLVSAENWNRAVSQYWQEHKGDKRTPNALREIDALAHRLQEEEKGND